MTLHGTLNHVSITVSDLDGAMEFFRPFLKFFGYTVGSASPYAGTRLTVNVNEGNGIAINIWEAKEQHPFKVYEPGLHHIAINAGSRRQVDEALEIVQRANLHVLDGPGEFPFAIGGYYAFYFLGPDNLKFEVVHMPSLENERAMNQRLTFVALSVSNLERSLRFYRDALGLPLRDESHDSDLEDPWYGGPHAAFSWTDGAFIHFALYPSQDPHRPVSTGAQIGFHVSGFDAAHTRIVRAGFAVVQEPRSEPWGRTARYLDPDRNIVSITAIES